jgi:hypothetical protein
MIPAVVEAIAAIAETRGPATYRASLPYARDSGIQDGLYYLGDARAVGAFARFVRQLPWPREGTRPAFRSIGTDLDAFDREVTAAYETMDRSQHTTYILTSAAIKQARTLNDGQQYAAALFEYLIARLRFAPLRGIVSTATAGRIGDARRDLNASLDTSIPRLFLEMAASAIESGEPAQQPTAAYILEDVLPAYTAALAPPRATSSAADPAKVTITLVRWPYT